MTVGDGLVEDSIRCLKNISIYTEYVKTNNFKDAYTPWMSVFTEAPKAQVSTYTNKHLNTHGHPYMLSSAYYPDSFPKVFE